MSTIEKKFHISDNSASIVRFDQESLRDNLPAGIYSVTYHPMMGWGLDKRSDSFDLPPKIFGDTHKKVQRLMKRYEVNGEVSALLSGAKGSGKTLLAHVFCNEAISKGKAVILVEHDFDNPNGLKSFLYDIGNAVFIFDEFAKSFDKDSQNVMLDFFSGSNYSKRATFVIENRSADINEFMIERPGRIRFHFKYGKLPIPVVIEVCKHYKLSVELSKLIVNYAARSYTIGMDTLSRLIEECVMDEISTKEDFDSLINDLNIPTNNEIEYKLTGVWFNNKQFSALGLHNINVRSNNIHGHFHGCENHPLVKEILAVAETDERIAALVDAIKCNRYDDNDEEIIGVEYNWYDFDVHCNRPVFTMGGELTYIDKLTGITFIVSEDRSDELGDLDSLLV